MFRPSGTHTTQHAQPPQTSTTTFIAPRAHPAIVAASAAKRARLGMASKAAQLPTSPIVINSNSPPDLLIPALPSASIITAQPPSSVAAGPATSSASINPTSISTSQNRAIAGPAAQMATAINATHSSTSSSAAAGVSSSSASIQPTSTAQNGAIPGPTAQMATAASHTSQAAPSPALRLHRPRQHTPPLQAPNPPIIRNPRTLALPTLGVGKVLGAGAYGTVRVQIDRNVQRLVARKTFLTDEGYEYERDVFRLLQQPGDTCDSILQILVQYQCIISYIVFVLKYSLVLFDTCLLLLLTGRFRRRQVDRSRTDAVRLGGFGSGSK